MNYRLHVQGLLYEFTDEDPASLFITIDTSVYVSQLAYFCDRTKPLISSIEMFSSVFPWFLVMTLVFAWNTYMYITTSAC